MLFYGAYVREVVRKAMRESDCCMNNVSISYNVIFLANSLYITIFL